MIFNGLTHKKPVSGIYRIFTCHSGKVYVGSTKNLRKRYKEHKNELEGHRHCNIHLQRAFDKYGEDSFYFDVLEYCPEENLIEREQYWLDSIPFLFNICKIAGNCAGVKQSLDTREKLRKQRLGKSYVRNTPGLVGTLQCKKTGMWKARVTYHGKTINLGTFNTSELAQDAYQRALHELILDPNANIKPQVSRRNTSGFLGVSPTREGAWMAHCTIDKKRHYVGYFPTAEQANIARLTFIDKHTSKK